MKNTTRENKRKDTATDKVTIQLKPQNSQSDTNIMKNPCFLLQSKQKIKSNWKVQKEKTKRKKEKAWFYFIWYNYSAHQFPIRNQNWESEVKIYD